MTVISNKGEYKMQLQWQGVVIGAASFLIIGIFHPIVIKAEYYIGKRCWPVFLLCGLACAAGSLFIWSLMPSAILAVVGFSFLWSIRELFEQEQRVNKGWFPANPRKKSVDSGELADD